LFLYILWNDKYSCFLAMKNIILCTGGQSHAWQVSCYSHASRPEPPTCLAHL
jgi:hypothetical protein